MSVSKIVVLGAGQMGSGIAQVSLVSGLQVVLGDVSEMVLARSRAGIAKGLDILVRKEKLTVKEKEQAISGLPKLAQHAILHPLLAPPVDRGHRVPAEQHREVQVIAAGQAGDRKSVV